MQIRIAPSNISDTIYFHSMNRDRIWSALCKRCIPDKLKAIIRATYDSANYYVLHQGKISQDFQSGVR